MKTYFAPSWPDYQLLDSGNQQRLEKFGPYLVVKPDPTAQWQAQLNPTEWAKATAIFSQDQEKFRRLASQPKAKTQQAKTKATPIWQLNPQAGSQLSIDQLSNEGWPIQFENIKFYARLTPYKHLGFFPEQAFHWQWLKNLVEQRLSRDNTKAHPAQTARATQNHQAKPEIKALNLFAYTGVSSLVLAALGVKVTHVDSSYPAIAWAKKNQALSNLDPNSIRWIREDALKFVQRELKRGNQYQIIIMDPPGYGHGPHKEKWSFNQHFPLLLKICHQLLAPDAMGLLVNAYTQSSSILTKTFLAEMGEKKNSNVKMGEKTQPPPQQQGTITLGKLALPSPGPQANQANSENQNRVLSTGIFARWENLN